ncbi:hypothetical protein AW729_10595 [Methanosphaera sp. BMS]|nr:hypothetical protein AW729_10595 [Methanosphaera sp. BMS]
MIDDFPLLSFELKNLFIPKIIKQYNVMYTTRFQDKNKNSTVILRKHRRKTINKTQKKKEN